MRFPGLPCIGTDNSTSTGRHDEDTVIPASEAVLLSRYLGKTTHVRLLLSKLITHAEANSNATPTETWKLVSFWAEVLRN